MHTVSPLARRIPIRNVWYLLLYAWDLARWRDTTQAAVEASGSLLGLLAGVLAGTTRELLRGQLRRAHLDCHDEIRGIRGRVDFATSLKHMCFERGKAYCRFPVLSIDTLKNRIIRATLHRLASDSRLVSAGGSSEGDLRHELRAVVSEMDGVELSPITIADFSLVQLGSSDRDYAVPLAICALIQRLQMPAEQVGDQAMVALLKDEITFHRLFERFVLNYYRHRLTAYDVKGESLSWHDELGCTLVPGMRTDVTITEKRAPYRRLVIDTKYSIRTLAESPHGGEKFKSENLYQVYAYLRTQEHRSAAHAAAEGMLLYPTTSRELDEAMFVQGHRIRVATVDLSRPWREIEERLHSLVDAEKDDIRKCMRGTKVPSQPED
ncbi:MAG: hypothetical protein IH602_08035 [Bryobacteraceae bacterium]|nr:hypothetical protein [Bryobacteraceae bacterium]